MSERLDLYVPSSPIGEIYLRDIRIGDFLVSPQDMEIRPSHGRIYQAGGYCYSVYNATPVRADDIFENKSCNPYQKRTNRDQGYRKGARQEQQVTRMEFVSSSKHGCS